jgi:hypothetical protein
MKLATELLAAPSDGGGYACQIGAILKGYRIFPWQGSLISLSRKTQRAFSSQVCRLSLAVTHRDKPEFAFATTHDVFIIGHGLARDDFLLRSNFVSNLPCINSFSGVRRRRIFIINPDPQAESNYAFVLSRGYADLLNSRFSEEHINLMIQRKGNA